MRILFEDDLVESVVGLCANGRLSSVLPEELRHFHADRERCYGVPDPDDRTQSFARLHLDWFTRWGLRGRLEEALGRFQPLSETLEAMVFRRARGRHDEGSELYQDASDQRRGVLALRPDRLVTAPALAGFLHHELAHLADMVDPAFGYAPRDALANHAASLERLIRERYRLLWSIRVDGRLVARELPALGDCGSRRNEFEKAFAFLPESRRASLFASLWDGSLGTHEELLCIASDPRNLASSREPTPGAPCPLCGFAAFRWSTASDLLPRAVQSIRAEFPGWRDDEPICARCGEIYESISGVEYPTTVLVGA